MMPSVLVRTMYKTLGRNWSRPFVSSSCRKVVNSYEGDGKTTVTILNQEVDSPLMIDAYNQVGFRLNNGMSVIGPLALFPKSAIGWDIKCAADITPESLSAFLILEPKIDILVIGVGDSGQQVQKETQDFVRSTGMRLEILTTEHACKTFNFLNVENRCVAAALIPMQTRRLGSDEEAFQARVKQQQERDFFF